MLLWVSILALFGGLVAAFGTICRCRCAHMCWRCRPGSPAPSISSS